MNGNECIAIIGAIAAAQIAMVTALTRLWTTVRANGELIRKVAEDANKL